MINISYSTHPEMYFNYLSGLEFLRSINIDSYEYPKNITYFHIYTDISTDKELECVKSYLATQNLEKTRLVLWSDYKILNNKLIQPYKHLIDMRVYNPEVEMKGTVLEGCERWIKANDSLHYMRSGILRFLATYKYGGIWADMDMIFLRDFKPVLDQEWAYMWGSEVDFYNFGPCAAMMNIKKESKHSNLCMNEIARSPVGGEWSTILDHQLLAKVYTQRQFDVFPSTFFNTEWLISKIDKDLSIFTEQNWFSNVSNIAKENLFLDAFSWHWHNSSNKHKTIQDGSKFDLLRKRTNKLLKERGIDI